MTVSPAHVRVAGLVPITVTPCPKSRSQLTGLGGGVHERSPMSQRAPVSLSEQPMFFDGDRKNTLPSPTSAGTNVVVVAGALAAGPAEELPDPLDPLGFDAESDPPHAATRTTRTTNTAPSRR